MGLTEGVEPDAVRKWNELGRNAARPQACTGCGSKARQWWNGWQSRTGSVREECRTLHVADVRQRRVRCSACGTSRLLRPPGLLPNKHYQGCVIASAVEQHVFRGDSLEQVARDHGCSRRQVARWLALTAAIADPAVLGAKLVEAVDAVVLPARRETAKRLQAVRDETRRRVLERAAQVLALTEVLASALGLEPPGLRSVIERFLNGRTDVGTYRRPVIPDLARGTQLM